MITLNFMRRSWRTENFTVGKLAKEIPNFGPAPAPLFKLNNKYCCHILLKQKREIDPSVSCLRQLLKQRLYKQKELQKWLVQIQIDMDPVEIM